MTQTTAPKNKQTIILEAIRTGGATRDSLMAAADVNKAGLASQLAYLNSRGQAMAEVDAERAEYPMQDENGIFFMGTHAQYEAKRANTASGFTAKPKTAAEVVEVAQKREDKASAAYSKANQKATDNPNDAIYAKVAEIRKHEMELASMKLSRVQAGDFSYENVTIVIGVGTDGTDATVVAPAKGKKGPKPGSDEALV